MLFYRRAARFLLSYLISCKVSTNSIWFWANSFSLSSAKSVSEWTKWVTVSYLYTFDTCRRYGFCEYSMSFVSIATYLFNAEWRIMFHKCTLKYLSSKNGRYVSIFNFMRYKARQSDGLVYYETFIKTTRKKNWVKKKLWGQFVIVGQFKFSPSFYI